MLNPVLVVKNMSIKPIEFFINMFRIKCLQKNVENVEACSRCESMSIKPIELFINMFHTKC